MYRAPPPAAPIVVGCIYKRIVGFDRRAGAHAWVFDAGGAITRVVVARDRVFAAGSDRVVCLQYATGALVWNVSSPVPASTFLVDGDEIFVASSTGEVAAFSATDGRFLWYDPLKGWGQFSVALATPGSHAAIDN
jgi:outer membrane protein assembly factor BamB